MVEPQIKSRLESNHFVTLDPKVKARLDQCLAVDFMHFTPGKRDMNTVDGKAVHALQEALTKIKQNILLSLPAITDSPGDYSSTTKAAVLSYKSDKSHVIIRQGQRLDDVIGRMTITQIDNDLLAIEGKSEPPKPPTPPPTVKVLQDVYVKIFGFGNASDQGKDVSERDDALQFAKDINSQPGYLDNHAPLVTIWFVGGQSPSPTNEIVARIKTLSETGSLTMGRIIIIGGSAGGKNVLQVADRVQQLGLKVTYIALWDGAFQREDLLNPAEFDDDANFDRSNPKTLNFKGTSAISMKENFFQSWGHCLDKHQEIHGSVDGFTPTDLTFDIEIEVVKGRFEANIIHTGRNTQEALEQAHIIAFNRGRNSSENTARLLLKPTK